MKAQRRFKNTKHTLHKIDRKAKRAFHAIENFFEFAEAAGEITHAISGGAYGDNLRKGAGKGKELARDASENYDRVYEHMLRAEEEGRQIRDEIKYILDG